MRALSVRRIRPLGSDQEIEFNVRVIAATNVDLMELVQRGDFRDDLYYRLKVISIQTPPLRQRKDDIPILANHFLKDFVVNSGRPEVAFSRGALEKIIQHDWPGNVRELKNCITRALAFAEGDVLYAEDLVFDDATLSPGLGMGEQESMSHAAERVASYLDHSYRRDEEQNGPERTPQRQAGQSPSSAKDCACGGRAEIALRLARERGSFSRLDYQNAVGAEISQRTAQYDLQALVKAGALRKTGKGPSTLYLVW